eukprot:MONOS_13024.1-p1 / transcript=MONOS_13024.1 / gene=MONOS_13024 / organism=Monocercomonoides_exilis_PA203 / gene_product=unspecified product / transcript_product=unspecified product / location=Mono_scaffold00768:421-1498(-) / protein_length=314 / sequence_SO=supercontig / SO=protein_coding / is_pseudo=false
MESRPIATNTSAMTLGNVKMPFWYRALSFFTSKRMKLILRICSIVVQSLFIVGVGFLSIFLGITSKILKVNYQSAVTACLISILAVLLILLELRLKPIRKTFPYLLVPQYRDGLIILMSFLSMSVYEAYSIYSWIGYVIGGVILAFSIIRLVIESLDSPDPNLQYTLYLEAKKNMEEAMASNPPNAVQSSSSFMQPSSATPEARSSNANSESFYEGIPSTQTFDSTANQTTSEQVPQTSSNSQTTIAPAASTYATSSVEPSPTANSSASTGYGEFDVEPGTEASGSLTSNNLTSNQKGGKGLSDAYDALFENE